MAKSERAKFKIKQFVALCKFFVQKIEKITTKLPLYFKNRKRLSV